MFVFARALALFPRPGTGNANTTTGPISAPSAGGFYGSLLENRKWWGNELESEGMMALSLPSRATKTNGTYLLNQMQHQLIMGMITWHDTCVDASARLTRPLFRRLRGCFSGAELQAEMGGIRYCAQLPNRCTMQCSASTN